MIHTDYAGAARKALLSVLGADAYTRAACSARMV